MLDPLLSHMGDCTYFRTHWTHISPMWAMKPTKCPYETHLGPFHYRIVGIFTTLAHIRPTSVPHGRWHILLPILGPYSSHMGNKNPRSTHTLPIWEMLAHMRQIITTWVPYSVV